jgi:GH25 family lysozyme M1 (1,4-beta-N-acetylmuramidase)
MGMQGIDVSENNGSVDWAAVAAAGIEFVMVRAAYGKSGVDSQFAANVAGAHAVGLKVGAFHYSYALTIDDAKQEAEHCKQIIADAGVLLELPVFFDMEDADGWKMRHGGLQDDVTEICRAFLANLGLDCGVYASYSWLTDQINWRGLGCAVWNAQWGNSDDIKGYMWQHTDSLNINGQCFDGDILYQ